MNEGWGARPGPRGSSLPSAPLPAPARSPLLPGRVMGPGCSEGSGAWLCWSLHKPVVPPPWGEELLAGPWQGCWGALQSPPGRSPSACTAPVPAGAAGSEASRRLLLFANTVTFCINC